MGAVSPADNWDADREHEFAVRIMHPLLAALAKRGTEFRGLLFPGLIITETGLHVLEFNCRFGDPETQAILPRINSDLLPLLNATIEGRLQGLEIQLDSRVAVTVVLASGGYPGKYETGKPISGLQDAEKMTDVHIFHAGTKRQNGEIVSAGGRVLAVTALADTVDRARKQAYAAVDRIDFEGRQFRRDIALPPSANKLGARQC
jgi:phosphoribosylamine--glycine ligase